MESDAGSNHADIVRQIRQLALAIEPASVAHAFVASIASRKLEYRSALGSYALARVLPEHPLVELPGCYATTCRDCGWSQMPRGEEEPIEHLARERVKYGGVRHLDPRYVAFDLEQFRTLPVAAPTSADWEALRLILRTPRLLASTGKALDLERAIKDIIPSNKNERGQLLRILSYAGILEADGYPGLLHRYIPPDARVLPSQRFADWGYPVIWWRAAHGVSAAAVSFWFPELAH